MKSDTKPTALLTFTGLFAAMITIMTAWLFHIPYGANGGYIHFGPDLSGRRSAAPALCHGRSRPGRRACGPSHCPGMGAGHGDHQNADRPALHQPGRPHFKPAESGRALPGPGRLCHRLLSGRRDPVRLVPCPHRIPHRKLHPVHRKRRDLPDPGSLPG